MKVLQDLLSPGANAKSTARRDCGGSKVVRLPEGAALPDVPSDLTGVGRGENMVDKKPLRLGVPRGEESIGGERSPNNAPNPLKGDEAVE